jgi:proline iminopeptidase
MQLVALANRSPRLHRAATSALGTYAAYVAHGLAHPGLLVPNGASSDANRILPGDNLVTAPTWATDFSTEIAATPEDIWPWIVQIGYGRGGWYTWYPLDNNGVASADIIVPALQRLAVGDVVPDGPRAKEGFGVWRVVELEPERSMVLYSHRHPTTGRELQAADALVPSIACSWVFALQPECATHTRLHVRVRAKLYTEGNPVSARLARWFFGLGDTVMENTMLEGIRQRAEVRTSCATDGLDAGPAAIA